MLTASLPYLRKNLQKPSLHVSIYENQLLTRKATMKVHSLTLTSADTENPSETVKAKVIAIFRDEHSLKRFQAFLDSLGSTTKVIGKDDKRKLRGKLVQVTHIDRETAPHNFQHIYEAGKVFRSASECSIALECHPTYVTTALRYAKTRGKSEVTIRGVTLEYLSYDGN